MVDGAADCSALVAELRYRVIFVLEELCLNVREHGGVPGRSIHVLIRECASSLVISVRDGGIPFDPLVDAPAPDLSGPLRHRRVGGLGVFLVRGLVDDFSYERDGQVNSIRMVLRPDRAPVS